MRIGTLLAGLWLYASTMYGGAIVSVDPGTVNAGTGSGFSVGITLSGLPDVVGFQFDVVFPEFLSLDSVVESGYFAVNGVSFSPGTPGVGTVTGIFDILISPGPIPDPDTLVTLSFIALSAGTGTISVENVMLLDSSFFDAEIDAVNPASVTVADVPEPASMLLVLSALAGVALLQRQFRLAR